MADAKCSTTISKPSPPGAVLSSSANTSFSGFGNVNFATHGGMAQQATSVKSVGSPTTSSAGNNSCSWSSGKMMVETGTTGGGPFKDALGEDSSTADGGLEERHHQSEGNAAEDFGYREALKVLLKLALPSMVTVFMVFALSGLAFAAAGRLLGTDEVPAVSISFFFISIVGLYPLAGIAFAVDTVCSQEFGRDPSSQVQGEVTQRSMVIATMILIPLSYALQHTEPLLQRWYDHGIAEQAALWISRSPWFLFPTIYSTNMGKFLCNQMKPHLPSIALTSAVVATPFCQYFFIKNFGFVGSSYGLGAAATIQCVVMVTLAWRDIEARDRFGPWRWTRIFRLKDIALYFKLGLPSVLFVCAESGAFDITALQSALLSKIEAAAWTVMLSVFLTIDCVCSGFSIAVCAAVGSALGANAPQKAKLLAKTAVLATAAVATVNGTLLYLGHRWVYRLYTNDVAVLDATSRVAWIIIPFHISDSIQFAFQGVFSGAGMNHIGAVVLIVCLWGVGISSIFIMLKAGHGLISVPLGLGLGLVLICPILAYFCFYHFDWEAIAKAAAEEAEINANLVGLPRETEELKSVVKKYDERFASTELPTTKKKSKKKQADYGTHPNGTPKVVLI